MNSFRNIFRKAFAISFSSPYLILLGVVAFFGASYSFVDASLNQLFGVITAQDILSDLVVFYQGEIMHPLFAYIQSLSLASLTFSQITALGTGILAIVYVTTIAHITVILEVKNKIANKRTTLSQSFVHAHSHILDVITLSLLGRIILALGVLLAATPVAFSYALSHGASVYLAVILFMLLYIPVTIIVSLTTNYAVIANVFDEKNFFNAVKQGFATLKNNALVSIELLVSLALLQLFIYLVIVSLAGVVFIPISATLSSLLFVGQSVIFSILLAVVVILCVLAIVALLGWYQVMYTSTLCVAYYGMNNSGLMSKLHRLIENGIKRLLPQATTQSAVKAVVKKVDDAQDNLHEVIDEIIGYFESVQDSIKEQEKYVAPKIKAQALKFAKQSKPLAKQASAQVMADIDSLVDYAMPMIEEGFVKIQKKVKKSKPYINKIKETIENTYIKELEDELSKLFTEVSSQKSVVSKKKGKAKKKR